MRTATFLLAFVAACGSGSQGRSASTLPATTVPVRVVYNSYRKGSTVLVMENEAGRDIVKLRSRTLAAGEAPVAYVPDDVMAKMFEEFDRYGFSQYAKPRPQPHPSHFGAVGELTIVTNDQRRTGGIARMLSLLRTKNSPGAKVTDEYVASNKSYVNCANTYVVVYNHFGPRLQATTTTSDPFGVKRADAGR